ncbi:MAG: hypothetical protein U0166_21850 [Acidobacteriota bacterium]
MRFRRGAALFLWVAPAFSQGADKLLVNPQDYPTTYDALNKQISGNGLVGGSKVIPMETKLMSDGVRVMPIQMAVSGRLTQIASLLDGLRRVMPYASRPYEVVLTHSDPKTSPGRPFHIEILLALPVLPSLQAADEATRGELLAARATADGLFWQAEWDILDALLNDPDGLSWLETLLVRDKQVAIDGVLPPSVNEKSLVDRVKKLRGYVGAELYGPQADPESSDHRKRFRSIGTLDVPSNVK